MNGILRACCFAMLLACGLPCIASADVQRFAVVIGNNAGDASDAKLRYAESDAAKVYEALRDLGGFAPANMLLLKGEDARTIEETLIDVNERVRASLSQPENQVLLFVYYSGHADAEALHLGKSRLPTRLLTQLVRGSAATFRLMVLDACRLGSVTRSKGGRIVSGSPLATAETLPENGLAILAASSAYEDAQESDEIGGSFFTHAFVSGLLGAADQDGDGAVTLSEAYDYAYAATLRASSRTLFGTQHPSFRYDFAGQGGVVLTRPELFAATRATLAFPPGVGFLVLRDGSDGAVVGEVGPHARQRSLSVRPGRYFVRGRGSDALYEAELELAAGHTTQLDPSTMQRVDYARLVRKGGRSSGLAHGPDVGPSLRTPLSNSTSACWGAFVGYGAQFEQFALRGAFGVCNSTFENRRISATVNEYDFALRASRGWDFGRLSFDAAVGGGGALFTQQFRTRGSAPSRASWSPFLLVATDTSIDLANGYALGFELRGETHFLRLAESTGGSSAVQFALRLGLFVRRWL